MALSMRKSISIDLRLTLFPSFTLALFEERERNLWVKIVGYDKGSIIKLENGVIEYNCRWIDPRVADAYLLFTGIDMSSSPIDIHLKRMNYRIFGIPYKYEPTKSICIKYWCSECPRNRVCIRWLFTNSFRELAGWLQTISYLHDRLYCSKGLRLKCPLKDLCRESGRAVRSDNTSRKSKKSSCEEGKEEIL